VTAPSVQAGPARTGLLTSGLALLLLAAWPMHAVAAGICSFKKQSPITVKSMGPCNFDPDTLSFAGDAVQQAMCLLTPVQEGGKLGAPLEALPAVLAERVGRSENLPDKTALLAVVKERGLDVVFADRLLLPASRANDNDPQLRGATYMVLHDTSAPNFRTRPWPQNIDEDRGINSLARYSCDNNIERAHIFINRMGDIFAPHDFGVPWRATKFEMATNFEGRTKGLFLHVELVQPRKRHPKFRGNNDFLAPSPGFPPAQYDALALTYAIASLRAGLWLIPAFHSVLDEGIYDKHDDPQNFDLDAFAGSLSKLLDRLKTPG
jgi:hypothetical protein